MSYSFNVTANGPDEAKEKAGAEFDKVIEQQPIHQADRDAAETAVINLIDTLQDCTDGQCIAVSVSGSCWRNEGEEGLQHASVVVDVKNTLRTAA